MDKSAALILLDFKVFIGTMVASSPESESSSEVMRSITEARHTWLATLALTASKILAMAAAAAC